MWTRRSLMGITLGALGAATVSPYLPAHAMRHGDRRLVVIVLRGDIGVCTAPFLNDVRYTVRKSLIFLDASFDRLGTTLFTTCISLRGVM